MELGALELNGRQDEFLDLSRLWNGLASGSLVMVETWYSPQECFLVLRRRNGGDEKVRAKHLAMLNRFLLGESQKRVAIEVGVSVSTVAAGCAACLRAMGDNRTVSRVALPIVMAAHAAAGFGCGPGRLRPAQGLEGDCWVLRVERPCSYRRRLTPRESEVVDGLVEGLTHAQIAALHGSAPRTVANQLGSAFRKLGVSGRGELLALLARDSGNASGHASSDPNASAQFAPTLPALPWPASPAATVSRSQTHHVLLELRSGPKSRTNRRERSPIAGVARNVVRPVKGRQDGQSRGPTDFSI